MSLETHWLISTQVDDRVQRGYYDRTPMEDEDVDEELLSPLELDELRAKRIRTGAAADQSGVWMPN